MKKFSLYSVLTFFSLFVAAGAAWAGTKHMGAGIALPSAHLADSPWFLVGTALLVGIIAFRLLRRRSS